MQPITDTDFSWLPAELRDLVISTMDAPMPRGRARLVYRMPPLHLGLSHVDGKPHVIFVAYYAYPSVIKKAITLRQCMDVHITFVGCCIREDIEILHWVDEAYEVQDYAELHTLMKSCAAHAVHVTVPHWPLGAIVMDGCRQSRMILDIVDSALYRENTVDHYNCQMEKALLQRADVLIHKMPEPALEKLIGTYGVDIEAYLCHSLPWRELFDSASVQEERFHLVFGGGVMPQHVAMNDGHGHHLFTPIIEACHGQGIKLDFFVNQNARDMFWEEHAPYVAMERSHPGFRFRPGLAFHVLPHLITRYHCGLLYDNQTHETWNKEHFRFNMATKIFTYMEAGLPIFVHDAFEYIAELVARENIGLVYPIHDLTCLRGVLEKADLQSMRTQAVRWREENELMTTAPDLIAAMKL